MHYSVWRWGGVEAPEPRVLSRWVLGDLRRPGPACTLITPASRDGREWGGLLQWAVGPFRFSDDFKCIHLRRKNSIDNILFRCIAMILQYIFGVNIWCLRNLLFIVYVFIVSTSRYKTAMFHIKALHCIAMILQFIVWYLRNLFIYAFNFTV